MGNTKRNSFIVKAGRVYQSLSPIFEPIDFLYRKTFLKINNNCAPIIVLLSPPRSGSTLTYQLLTSAFKNFHLTNIWNLLYATPTIGAVISKKLIADEKVSSFTSHHGFVHGITGEAEGMKFWTYWTGQGLSQENSKIKEKKFNKFTKIINALSHKFQQPFICGYLGHVFCIEELRKRFNNIIFVYLTRDLLANACSLYRVEAGNYFSIMPNTINIKEQNRFQQIAKQLVSIHANILEHKHSDTFNYSYEELCKDPMGFVKYLQAFAKERGINLEIINKKQIPKNFKISNPLCTNEVTGNLYKEINNEIYRIKPVYKKEIKKLL